MNRAARFAPGVVRPPHRTPRTRRSGSRWSAPATGGAVSTPSCSPAAPTRRWWPSSGAIPDRTARAGRGVRRTRPTSTSRRCSTANGPTWCRSACRTRRHFEPTLRLIRAGVPLLVEKPLVFSLDEADTLIAEAAARNLFVGINFNHRYAKPVRLAAAAIARGDLGRLAFATWRFGGEAGTSRHPHANLIETQCHGFDMLEHLCGPIDSVMAQTGRPERQRLVDAGGGAALRQRRGRQPGRQLRLVVRVPGHAPASSSTAPPGGCSSRTPCAGSASSAPVTRSAQVWQAGYFNDTDRDFHATFDRHVDDAAAGAARRARTAGAGRRRTAGAGARLRRHPLLRHRHPGRDTAHRLKGEPVLRQGLIHPPLSGAGRHRARIPHPPRGRQLRARRQRTSRRARDLPQPAGRLVRLDACSN